MNPFTNRFVDFAGQSLAMRPMQRISLVNISGSQVKLIVPQTTLMPGINSFEANLSDVAPGIYLVSIITEHGYKTQRVIVAR